VETSKDKEQSKEAAQPLSVQGQPPKIDNIIRMPSEGQKFSIRGTKFEVIKSSGFTMKCKVVYNDYDD